MRRISDGVKTSQRYKTTDQVERAHVEDHEYSFLYKDGDGFHFMNQENYEQVMVPPDIVGDYEKYLQEGMVVSLRCTRASRSRSRSRRRSRSRSPTRNRR